MFKALSFSEQALDIAQQHLTLSEEAVQVVVERLSRKGDPSTPILSQKKNGKTRLNSHLGKQTY